MTAPLILAPIDVYRMGWYARQRLARRLKAEAREARRRDAAVTPSQRVALWVAALQDADPRDIQPCGTRAAYRRHVKAGEDACGPCKAANSADNTRRTRARRAKGVAA